MGHLWDFLEASFFDKTLRPHTPSSEKAFLGEALFLVKRGTIGKKPSVISNFFFQNNTIAVWPQVLFFYNNGRYSGKTMQCRRTLCGF